MTTTAANPAAPFTILIDGECPLCAREGRFLQRLDGGRGRLALVDITAPGFDPASYGTTFEKAMGAIHGVCPRDGVLTGVEVFRRAYAAVGYGWLLAWTAWPIARPIVDAAYRVFARIRPRLKRKDACDTGRCKV